MARKKARRKAKPADRKFEVRAEVANFTLAKAPQAALSLIRLRTGRHVRVAALAGCDRTLGALAKSPRSPALRLQIYSRHEKFGENEIGRGSLRWWSAHSPTEHRIPWTSFAQMMDERAHGKR